MMQEAPAEHVTTTLPTLAAGAVPLDVPESLEVADGVVSEQIQVPVSTRGVPSSATERVVEAVAEGEEFELDVALPGAVEQAERLQAESVEIGTAEAIDSFAADEPEPLEVHDWVRTTLLFLEKNGQEILQAICSRYKIPFDRSVSSIPIGTWEQVRHLFSCRCGARACTRLLSRLTPPLAMIASPCSSSALWAERYSPDIFEILPARRPCRIPGATSSLILIPP